MSAMLADKDQNINIPAEMTYLKQQVADKTQQLDTQLETAQNDSLQLQRELQAKNSRVSLLEAAEKRLQEQVYTLRKVKKEMSDQIQNLEVMGLSFCEAMDELGEEEGDDVEAAAEKAAGEKLGEKGGDDVEAAGEKLGEEGDDVEAVGEKLGKEDKSGQE
jgi:chromosome segregation ATPase